MSEIFVHEQPIRFAHCDPAGIVYFPRFFDLAHTVMEDWLDQGVGAPMHTTIPKRRIGTPTVAIHCDFSQPMRIGDILRFELRVTRIGRTSVELEYKGFHGDALCLHIRQTIVFMDLDAVKAIPIPPEWRGRIERFLVG